MIIVRAMLRQLWRDRRLPLTLVLFATLVVAAVAFERMRATAHERERTAAERVDAQTFEQQGARNPHSVAHFSRFAFAPRLDTAMLDGGIADHVGTAVWMEAHAQDPANARPAEDHLDLARIARLDLAWLWQVVVPLLIIGLGFDAISRERERRTLALVLVGGRSLRTVVFGKAVTLAGVFLLALVGSAALAVIVAEGVAPPDRWARLAWWLVGHAIYILTWTVLVLAASTVARASRTALIGLLAVWVACVLVAPRVIATVADEHAPAPTGDELRAIIKHDLEQGFDGHGGNEERAKAFEARVLAEYAVNSVAELPVSFAGLQLAEGERVGNLVFDRRYGELAARYRAQRALRRTVGIVSPLVALQHVSMAAAGTSVEHHVEFTAQAEQQRRVIVDLLNADLVQHGKGKDFDYLADPALWRTIPTFRYAPPAMEPAEVAADLGVLAAWLVVASLALGWAVRRADAQVLA